jgi:hypothetical protein
MLVFYLNLSRNRIVRNYLEILVMKLMDAFNADLAFNPQNQQHSHFQMVVIFKSFIAMLAGDDSLRTVGEMSDALVETPAFDLAAQQLKRSLYFCQLRSRQTPHLSPRFARLHLCRSHQRFGIRSQFTYRDDYRIGCQIC